MCDGAVADSGASLCTGSLTRVLLLLFLQVFTELQVFADQADLPSHVDHTVLHALHLPAQCRGNGSLRLSLGLVLLLQLSVAVVLGLSIAAQQCATTHRAQLPPVAAGLSMCLGLLPQYPSPTALLWAQQPLEWACGAVEILL